MFVSHLTISAFLCYGLTPRPMAGPVGRQVTAPGISELLHTWGPSAPSPSGGRSHTRSVELRRDSKISGFLLARNRKFESISLQRRVRANLTVDAAPGLMLDEMDSARLVCRGLATMWIARTLGSAVDRRDL